MEKSTSNKLNYSNLKKHTEASKIKPLDKSTNRKDNNIYEIQNYASSQVFKNDLFKKIYKSHTGEIIKFLRKTNENLREDIRNVIFDNQIPNAVNKNKAYAAKGKNKDFNINNKNNITYNDLSKKFSATEDNFFADKSKAAKMFYENGKNKKSNDKAEDMGKDLQVPASDKKLQNKNKNIVNDNFIIKKKHFIYSDKVNKKHSFTCSRNSAENYSFKKKIDYNNNEKINKTPLMINKSSSINGNIFATFPNQNPMLLSDKTLNSDYYHPKNFQSSNKANKPEAEEAKKKAYSSNKTKSNFFISQNFISEDLNINNKINEHIINGKNVSKNTSSGINLKNHSAHFKGYNYSLVKQIEERLYKEENLNYKYKTRTDFFNKDRTSNNTNYKTFHDLKELKNATNYMSKTNHQFFNNNKNKIIGSDYTDSNPNIKIVKNKPVIEAAEKHNLKKFDLLKKVNNKLFANFPHSQGSSDYLNNASIKESRFSKNKEVLIEKVLTKKNNFYYCPNCDHCNNIVDDNLEKHFQMKEAKNIIKKCFDQIANNYQTKQNFLDFLLQKNPKENDFNIIEDKLEPNHKKFTSNKESGIFIKNLANSTNTTNEINSASSKHVFVTPFKKEDIISNNIESNNNNCTSNKDKNIPDDEENIEVTIKIKSNDKRNNKANNTYEPLNEKNNNNNDKYPKFVLENLLTYFPNQSSNRDVLKIVTHFLDALINDKISIESVSSPETLEKLKDILISQGLAFKENNGVLDFDKELELMFDKETIEKLKKLFKSNILLSKYI